jgi:flagellar motor switch protein FliM
MTTVSELNPFRQTRLLTTERAQLFTRTAETLAERLGDEVGRWLPDATVQPGQVEQTTIVEMAKPETDLAVVKSSFHLSYGIIATDLNLALSIVATLCGGVGQPPPEVLRPLSRLEMGVFDLVLTPMLDQATRLFEVGDCEIGNHVANVLGLPDTQHEPIIAVPLQLTVGSIEGHVTVGFTASQLQVYLEELDRRIAGRLASKQDTPSIQIVRAVKPVPVDMVVGFELLDVPAGQLANLQIGDVLLTKQLMSKSLVARVGSERIFNVRAAQRGQRLVAEIIGRIGEKGQR